MSEQSETSRFYHLPREKNLLGDLAVIREAMEDLGRELDKNGYPRLFYASGDKLCRGNGDAGVSKLDWRLLMDELGLYARWERESFDGRRWIAVSATPLTDALKIAVSAASDRVAISRFPEMKVGDRLWPDEGINNV